MARWWDLFSRHSGGTEDSASALPERFTLVDCRGADEYSGGHLRGAILLPHDQVPVLAAAQLPDRSGAVLVYCQSGRRSAMAAAALRQLGYSAVTDLGGLRQAGRRTGLPLAD